MIQWEHLVYTVERIECPNRRKELVRSRLMVLLCMKLYVIEKPKMPYFPGIKCHLLSERNQ
jgi:hypothetical protein